MENMSMALGLLVVGMVTVFTILCLVVVIGNLVIRLTNRFIPVVGLAAGRPGNGDLAERKAQSKKYAAIVAAVEVITKGHGRVESIEKK